MRLRGGRLLGSGTYGCVYDKELAPERGPGVSKLMSAYDAVKEHEQVVPFERADPHAQYGVYGSKPKRVSRSRLVQSVGGAEELAKCKYSRATAAIADGAQLAQIIMERARGDMLAMLKQAQLQKDKVATMAAHLRAARTLLRGVLQYASNGLAHHDIKPGNCVGIGEAQHGAPRVYKWIDFGLGADFTALAEAATNPTYAGGAHLFKQVYYYWPPLLTAYFTTTDKHNTAFKFDVSLDVFFKTPEALKVLRDTEDKNGAAKMTYERAMEFAHANGLTGASPGEEVRFALLTSIDTYSCGVLLRSIFKLGINEMDASKKAAFQAIAYRSLTFLDDLVGMRLTPEMMVDRFDNLLRAFAKEGFQDTAAAAAAAAPARARTPTAADYASPPSYADRRSRSTKRRSGALSSLELSADSSSGSSRSSRTSRTSGNQSSASYYSTLSDADLTKQMSADALTVLTDSGDDVAFASLRDTVVEFVERFSAVKEDKVIAQQVGGLKDTALVLNIGHYSKLVSRSKTRNDRDVGALKAFASEFLKRVQPGSK